MAESIDKELITLSQLNHDLTTKIGAKNVPPIAVSVLVLFVFAKRTIFMSHTYGVMDRVAFNDIRKRLDEGREIPEGAGRIILKELQEASQNLTVLSCFMNVYKWGRPITDEYSHDMKKHLAQYAQKKGLKGLASMLQPRIKITDLHK